MDHEEMLAWSAGFIDGEGTFYRGGKYPALSVGQVHREPLDRLRRTFGWGRVNGPYDVRDPRRYAKQEQYYFRLYRLEFLVRAAEQMWPFLGSIKRAQCERRLGPCLAWDCLALDPMTPRTRLSLAWAAGFFDAEGCFSYTPSVGACIAISQTDRELLDRMVDVSGLGKVYGPYAGDPIKHKKPIFQYRAHGHAKVQAIGAMLWPWLTTIKRGQAVTVLEQARAHQTGFCKRGHVKGVHTTGCPRCVAAAWARKRDAKRNGTLFEEAGLYSAAPAGVQFFARATA